MWRGAEIESVHRVHASVVEAPGTEIARAGDSSFRTFLRSAAKPVQLLPLVEDGLVARWGFTGEEIAVMAASHGGEPFHVAAVERILDKVGLGAGMLRCGPHPPLYAPAARALEESGQPATALHNNCSGKHAGMLAVCRAREWPLETYLDPGHPLQQRIGALVAELAGEPAAAIGRATDGCGLPTLALSVRAMATLFARLAGADMDRDTDRERAVGVIFDAMAAHPEYVAGTSRLCTELMARAGARVVVKTGAEGVYCGALRGARQGIALKVEDGARRAQDVALLALLSEMDVIDAGEDSPVSNRAGAVVGRIDARLALERLA